MTVHVLKFPENRRSRANRDAASRPAAGQCEVIELFRRPKTEHCSSAAASNLCARDFQPGS